MNYPDHGGNIRELAERAGISIEEVIDFSASINPLGPPEWLRSVVNRELDFIGHYPDRYARDFREAVSRRYGIDPSRIVPVNGSTELLYTLPRIVGTDTAVIPVPSYADYEAASAQAGLRCRFFDTGADNFELNVDRLAETLGSLESDGREWSSLVFLGNPNNPTGFALERERLAGLIADNPDHLFLVDEAFIDFLPEEASLAGTDLDNLIVSRSSTKIFAIPGLRVGWCRAPEYLAEKITANLPTWSVNRLAQAAGKRAVEDTCYLERSREYVRTAREKLEAELSRIDELEVFPGTANYIFIRSAAQGSGTQADVKRLADFLLSRGIAVRDCSTFRGLDDGYFRVAVRTQEENALLVAELKAYFSPSVSSPARRKTPAVMLQGVSSNAGKSVLAAALCRILLSRGYRVLPFKAQNMALNSYVTSGGEEIGRAQAVQAAACRVEPDARMNPVLLKPSSNVGSQVIVMGKPIGSMAAKDYYGYKEKLVATVRDAYDSLSAEADVVVLEGAGSPAEMNLRPHDIVNMEMARYAEAAVLLAGDIDRGGVYASFIGTMEVLNHWERGLVKGFLVNKFRGDASLLEDAHRYLRERTGKQVLGVIPYLSDLGIPEEDSVTFKEDLVRGRDDAGPEGAGGRVRIRVIDLKHISNFTDFDCFAVEPDVDLRFVSTPEELTAGGIPDAVIIPGSKNVSADLEDLERRGFKPAIKRLIDERKTEILGICGGYQMLGREINDPGLVESAAERVAGLGFLPLTTVFGSEKTLSRKSARHVDADLPVEGYEIHHGATAGDAGRPLVVGEDGRTIGSGREDVRVWGTYLHGIFDADRFRRWYLDRLRAAKGLEPIGIPSPYDIDAALDRLAFEAEKHIDLEAILRSAGLA